MYWIYNVLLIFYWIGLIPVILYRLAFEDGFYERIKQSAGYMPATLLKKIEGRRAIWIHAASVGEIVATSPLVKEIKREFPEAVVVVSVVTATGHAMAHRIIPEAEGIIFFPLDSAIRRKFGQISVSTNKIAIGLMICKILRVKYGKSKGKKIMPSASGIIRCAIA